MGWSEPKEIVNITGIVSDPKEPVGDPEPENPPQEEPAEKVPEPQES